MSDEKKGHPAPANNKKPMNKSRSALKRDKEFRRQVENVLDIADEALKDTEKNAEDGFEEGDQDAGNERLIKGNRADFEAVKGAILALPRLLTACKHALLFARSQGGKEITDILQKAIADVEPGKQERA